MAKKFPKKPRSIGMTDPMYDELVAIASDEDTSATAIVEEAIALYLAQRKKNETEGVATPTGSSIQQKPVFISTSYRRRKTRGG